MIDYANQLKGKFLMFTEKEFFRGYPTAEKAGFHHCALIYENPECNVDFFRPLVSRTVDNKPTGEWCFDAFLFLIHMIDRQNTEIAALNMGALQTLIELYFAPGRYLDALNSAVKECAETTGVMPPSRRKVIIAIPWLNPDVEKFGDVNCDGQFESLSTQEGRSMVTKWFVEQIKRRFNASYPWLELWGFYLMRENISDIPATVQAMAEIIHRNELKLLWIPYYLGAGYADWEKYGVDVAIMQSNYTFTGFNYGGNVRGNRLFANAELCRKHGLGFEIELAAAHDPSPKERYFLLRTLELGSSANLGYQHAATAYYFGSHFNFCNSPDPELRKFYNAYCDYITGKEIKIPRQDNWNIEHNSDGITAECRFAEPVVINNVDIFFTERPEDAVWTGTAQLEGETESGWKCLGWAVRANRNPDEQSYQSITLPAGEKVSALRIAAHGSGEIEIFDIVADQFGDLMDLTEFQQMKIDDFRELDEPVNTGAADAYHCYWGRAELFTEYTLLKETACDTIKIKTAMPAAPDAGFIEHAGIIISPSHPVTGANGRGAMPENITVVPGQREDDYLVFRLGKTVAINHFSLAGRINGFAMLGEVLLLNNGIPTEVKITSYMHKTTSNPGGEYYSDGTVASWEVIKPELNGMTGFTGREPRVFTIQLPERRSIKRIELCTFYALLRNVLPPEKVLVEVMTDNGCWSVPYSMFIPPPVEKRNILRPNWLIAELPENIAVQAVRLTVCGSDKMTLLKTIRFYE